MYPAAVPTRGIGKEYIDHTHTWAFTGPPDVRQSIWYETDAAIPEDRPMIFEDQVEFIDEFTPEEITVLPPPEEENIEQLIIENSYVQDEDFPQTDLVESHTEAAVEDRTTLPIRDVDNDPLPLMEQRSQKLDI